jgi:hypothetical protein
MARKTRPDVAADRPFWERQRPRYLVSGFAKCGACGSSYVKISKNLFGCAAAHNKGTCTNRLNVPAPPSGCRGSHSPRCAAGSPRGGTPGKTP